MDAKNLEVLKAARTSLHGHFAAMKAAATAHVKAAQDHADAIHGLCDKCMKLAGEPSFEEGKEKTGGQELGGAKGGTVDTVVKSAKTPEQIAAKEAKRVAKAAFRETIVKLSEAVSKLASGEITVKAARAEDKVVGDRKDLKDTGTVVVDKDKVAKAASEANAELASRAFNQPGKPGDPKALSELYDRVVTRGTR